MPLSWNLGTLTSWNPLGHFRPVTGLIYLLFFVHKVWITKPRVIATFKFLFICIIGLWSEIAHSCHLIVTDGYYFIRWLTSLHLSHSLVDWDTKLVRRPTECKRKTIASWYKYLAGDSKYGTLCVYVIFTVFCNGSCTREAYFESKHQCFHTWTIIKCSGWTRNDFPVYGICV